MSPSWPREHTRIAFARETSGHVDASSVSADAVHDRALVDVDAPHVVLVQRVTLKNYDYFSDFAFNLLLGRILLDKLERKLTLILNPLIGCLIFI